MTTRSRCNPGLTVKELISQAADFLQPVAFKQHIQHVESLGRFILSANCRNGQIFFKIGQKPHKSSGNIFGVEVAECLAALVQFGRYLPISVAHRRAVPLRNDNLDHRPGPHGADQQCTKDKISVFFIFHLAQKL